jgi:hypothetical protein
MQVMLGPDVIRALEGATVKIAPAIRMFLILMPARISPHSQNIRPTQIRHSDKSGLVSRRGRRALANPILSSMTMLLPPQVTRTTPRPQLIDQLQVEVYGNASERTSHSLQELKLPGTEKPRPLAPLNKKLAGTSEMDLATKVARVWEGMVVIEDRRKESSMRCWREKDSRVEVENMTRACGPSSKERQVEGEVGVDWELGKEDGEMNEIKKSRSARNTCASQESDRLACNKSFREIAMISNVLLSAPEGTE